MEWTTIWAEYVLPIVASVGGFGAIFATIFTILKVKGGALSAAKSAANQTLDGVKTGITVSITEIVDVNLKPVREALSTTMETIKEPVRVIAQEQAEIRKAILAFGEFLGSSLSHGQDAKKALKKAMDEVKKCGDEVDEKVHEVTKIVPKTATATFGKHIERQVPRTQPQRTPDVVR